ncbi:MAG: hypothetical protein ACF8SC_05480 [Phycisphaerales bacterium JB037]
MQWFKNGTGFGGKLIRATLLSLAATLTIAGCGKSDIASQATEALEKKFRDGSIVKKMEGGERLAFARLADKGFRKRGSHTFEGYGIQYRFVRVEAVELSEDHLTRKNDDGGTDNVIPENLHKLIKDGDAVIIGELSYEVIPSESFIKDNIIDVMRMGAGGVERYIIVKNDDGEWLIPSGEFAQNVRRVLNAYRNDKDLKKHVIKRELAERLLTEAPKEEDENE